MKVMLSSKTYHERKYIIHVAGVKSFFNEVKDYIFIF